MGARTAVLVANYHAYLDAEKSQWDHIDEKSQKYIHDLATGGLTTIKETKDFYTTREYIDSLFHLSGHVDIEGLLNAGQTTLGPTQSPPRLSALLYVATQVLDVKYLGGDCAVCGVDESDIYRFGLPLLARVYQHQCTGLYLPMCPGLIRPEMHASDDENNKITLAAPASQIRMAVEKHIDRLPSLDCPTSLAAYCSGFLFPLAGEAALAQRLRDTIATKNKREVSRLLSTGLSDLLEPWRRRCR